MRSIPLRLRWPAWVARTRSGRAVPWGAAVLCALALAALGIAGCASPLGPGAAGPAANAMPGIGDAARGRALFTSKTCNGCHRVSGEISGSTTGPDLKGFADRPTIADGVPNTPDNLWHFLENPQRSKPGTRMPRMPLDGPELDDLVAYLETLH